MIRNLCCNEERIGKIVDMNSNVIGSVDEPTHIGHIYVTY